MGLHQRHTHGRVFRGLEASEHLHNHKRDSHRDQPIMNVPEGFDEQEQQGRASSGAQTAVSVVYVTLPQTFSGPAMYMTLTSSPNAAPTVGVQPANNPQPDTSAGTSKAATSSATVTSNKAGDASTPTAIATSTSSVGLSDDVSSSSGGPSFLAGSPIQATHSATSEPSVEQSAGMTGGAQAGLAIGLILGIALVAGLMFFCWRRKKSEKSKEEAVNNEKHGSFADAGARRVEAGAQRGSTMTEKVPSSLRSTRTASTAPRLSLRPVTQFLPNLAGNRQSSGNNLDLAAAGLVEKPKSSWERRAVNSGQNPFDDGATVSEPSRSVSPPSDPFNEMGNQKSNDFQETAAVAGVAAVAAARSPKTSFEGRGPAPPKPAQFRNGPAGHVGPAGPPPDSPRGPNNVHRVQLDFKPSMDDELELRSGQLVRMLHEYDDGWALCIRMDRSQQGVAPRTCLSKVPVKPRPQGPPPNARPGTSNGPRRPSNPSAPNGPPADTMYPRPLTPTLVSRSPSPTETSLESTASQGGVIPPRKPVPGQAM